MLSNIDEQFDTSAAVEQPPVENSQIPHPAESPDAPANPWANEEPQIDENGNPYYTDIKPDPDPTNRLDLQAVNSVDPTRKLRNCGRTGATTPIGKAIAARNATRHGMCAKTLILENESQEDWDELLTAWLALYQNPSEKTVLYTFIVKACQAEWFRLRIVREFDLFYASMDGEPLQSWPPEKERISQLMTRYLTSAERRANREKHMLEHHWKIHGKPTVDAKPAAEPAAEPPPTGDIEPAILFANNVTGEMEDAQRNSVPTPPDFKPEPIVPGQYPPDHPSRFGERQRKKKHLRSKRRH